MARDSRRLRERVGAKRALGEIRGDLGTHGGQIVLPFVRPLWAPSEFGARFAYGHIVEQGRHMIVSGGLGCSKVPLRLGVPPEIVRIRLGA